MFLYVANWKMNMPFYKAGDFCKENYYGFENLSKLPDKKIVLCPSYTEIMQILILFKDLELEVGAQNCSARISGPYTGQVSAVSLGEMGCVYCIVGHSEVRKYLSEGNCEIIQKVLRLIEVKVTPILCVGENEDDGIEWGKKVLFSQLEPVFEKIKSLGSKYICVAYEPIWSIGTGITPEVDYIEKIFGYIFEIAKEICPNVNITLLYGGSVNEHNVKKMKCIANLGGFLIGGASLDFKKFEKIVQL